MWVCMCDSAFITRTMYTLRTVFSQWHRFCCFAWYVPVWYIFKAQEHTGALKKSKQQGTPWNRALYKTMVLVVKMNPPSLFNTLRILKDVGLAL